MGRKRNDQPGPPRLSVPCADTSSSPEVVTTGWRDVLPVLRGARVLLRELWASDARALFALVSPAELSRFTWPPPTTVDGFHHFIDWAVAQRRAGSYACFAVTLDGTDAPIGIFQLRELEPGFGSAEWGFVLRAEHRGTGVFQEGARLVMDFAFDIVGVRRLEARAPVRNGRGNGALRKLGAVKEGLLRRSCNRGGEYQDEFLWTLLADDRLHAKVIWGGTEPMP
jgi:ribosomal-protein-alanine N-acetyltransferase